MMIIQAHPSMAVLGCQGTARVLLCEAVRGITIGSIYVPHAEPTTREQGGVVFLDFVSPMTQIKALASALATH